MRRDDLQIQCLACGSAVYFSMGGNYRRIPRRRREVARPEINSQHRRTNFHIRQQHHSLTDTDDQISSHKLERNKHRLDRNQLPYPCSCALLFHTHLLVKQIRLSTLLSTNVFYIRFFNLVRNFDNKKFALPQVAHLE